MATVRELLAQPFRRADGINRDVLISWLRSVKGRCLEVGPGGRPLLGDLEDDGTREYVAFDLPTALDRIHELG